MSNLVLIESGAAIAHIVVQENAAPTEHHAAQELQHHLELISGARLPIVSTAIAGQSAILIRQRFGDTISSVRLRLERAR